MNKIQKMIKELCPNGVEWKKLGKVVKSINIGLNPRKNFILNTNDSTCYYLTVKEITSGKIEFTNKTDRINFEAVNIIQERSKLEVNDILLSGIGTIGKVAIVDIDTKNWNCSESVYLIKPFQNIIKSKFLYYILQSETVSNFFNNKSVGSTLKGIRKNDLSNLFIPVPPLAVQEEIVKILDNFTELTAELTARKQQYEYYRDRLLSFDNILKRGGVIRKLGEVCEFIVGGDVPKNNYSKHKTSDYNIPIYSNGTDKNMLYGYTNQAKIDKPCVSISARGTIGYCKLHKQSFFPIVRLICAIPSESIVKSDYLRYCLDCINIKGTSTGIPQLTVPMVKTFLIPIPPLEVQEELVAILDNFERMCNSLSDGIPAEISARKLQYEYYRDKLLSFDNNVY